jgi:hypothetical protein
MAISAEVSTASVMACRRPRIKSLGCELRSSLQLPIFDPTFEPFQ